MITDTIMRVTMLLCQQVGLLTESVEFYVPLDTIIGHFGDESFQAITSCTGTDNTK